MKPNIFNSIINARPQSASVNIMGERCPLPTVQFDPFTPTSFEEFDRELKRRQQIQQQAVREAAMQKAERDKQKLFEQLSEQAVFSITYVPFVIAEVAWDYADTVLDMACIIRDRRTKPLGRTIKELRREYDRQRYRIINDKWRDSETENMLMFQDVLKDFFSKVYHECCEILEQTHGKLEDNTLMLVASVYVCRTVLKGLFMYTAAHEKCVSRILGYPIASILPTELQKLNNIIIEYAGDCRMPDSFAEKQKQFANELAEYINDTELDDSDKSTNKSKSKTSKIKKLTMEEMKDFVKNINEKFAQFEHDAEQNIEKGNKAAGVRARKVSLEIEKMLKQYRKSSVATKAEK